MKRRQKTISYTVAGGDTTTTIATALKNAINADSSLQAVGVQATSTANVVTLLPFTYYNGSSSGTETVSISNASRGSAAITIGSTVTTGDIVAITVYNGSLPMGQEVVSYSVLGGDTPTSIATALKNAINADVNLQAAKLTAISTAAKVTLLAYTNYTATTSGGATETLTFAAQKSRNHITDNWRYANSRRCAHRHQLEWSVRRWAAFGIIYSSIHRHAGYDSGGISDSI
ncbi:MAG: hypothetical protein EKK48_10240 [Candidatus Melainabacteria bacterium]|nr:MAG: hypothetical protein EKK48_10240 [Candidatus Melainabacteria bacterium]